MNVSVHLRCLHLLKMCTLLPRRSKGNWRMLSTRRSGFCIHSTFDIINGTDKAHKRKHHNIGLLERLCSKTRTCSIKTTSLFNRNANYLKSSNNQYSVVEYIFVQEIQLIYIFPFAETIIVGHYERIEQFESKHFVLFSHFLLVQALVETFFEFTNSGKILLVLKRTYCHFRFAAKANSSQ